MRIDLPEPEKFMQLLAQATGYHSQRLITGVTLDTRNAKSGDLYVAIAGTKVDGHDYLSQAVEKQCAAGLVSKANDSIEIPQICVDDPTATVSALAKEWRLSHSVEMTAITGSNGKTTTKDLLIHIFSAWHVVHGTRGNYNTHLGLPLTLLELDSRQTQSFLEMGANHRGDIGYLCSLSLPRHGLITNIAPSHLSSFGSIEMIKKTKGELFQSLPKDGKAFVNSDDKHIQDIETFAERISYGFTNGCDFSGDLAKDDDGFITLTINGEKLYTGSANQVFAKNVLAASSIASTLGISWDVIRRQVASFGGVKGRCCLEVKNGVTIIDDTYNANLTSTLAALDYLIEIPIEGKRHFVLGDMLELGDSSEDHHRQVGIVSSNKGVDQLYCYGSESMVTVESANGIEAHHYMDKSSLTKILRENIKSGDIVLFKASRGMALESVLDDLFR